MTLECEDGEELPLALAEEDVELLMRILPSWLHWSELLVRLNISNAISMILLSEFEFDLCAGGGVKFEKSKGYEYTTKESFIRKVSFK